MGKIIHNGVQITREITSLSSISARATSDGASTSAFGTVAISTDSQIFRFGNKFSLSSGNIIVGSEVSRIKVSGVLHAEFVNNSNSTAYDVGARIMQNNTGVGAPISMITLPPGATEDVSLPITPFVLQVTEGDIINIGVYSSTGNVTKTSKQWTYIFVEEA